MSAVVIISISTKYQLNMSAFIICFYLPVEGIGVQKS